MPMPLWRRGCEGMVVAEREAELAEAREQQAATAEVLQVLGGVIDRPRKILEDQVAHLLRLLDRT